MASVLPQPIGKPKRRFHSVKIDMTPMVDLGFLLITFFIFTTSLMEPTRTKLTMPRADDGGVHGVYEKALLTVFPAKGKVWIYEGAFEKAIALNGLTPTSYDTRSGLGHVIRQKQKTLQAAGIKEDLVVLIKPLPAASYQEVMNALDEMLINGVNHYAIIELTPRETEYLAGKRLL